MTNEEKQKIERLLHLHAAIAIYYADDTRKSFRVQYQANKVEQERDALAKELGIEKLYRSECSDFKEHRYPEH